MAKNTPGPWEARIKVEPFGIIGEIYADGTYLGRVDSSEVQSSAQEANAQLISAAPAKSAAKATGKRAAKKKTDQAEIADGTPGPKAVSELFKI